MACKEVNKPMESSPHRRVVMEKAKAMSTTNVGSILSDCELQKADGSMIKLSDFTSKLLVIDIWATWCSPCLTEAPFLDTLVSRFDSKDVEFISVSSDDSKAFWQEFIEENSYDYNQYWIGGNDQHPIMHLTYTNIDDEGQSNIVMGLPTFAIINQGREIISKQEWRPSNGSLENAIRDLLK